MAVSLAGKKILITGSTDGLGKLVARDLAKQNAIVLLHGRNREKGKIVLDELFRLTQNTGLKYYNGDYSSFDEVDKLCDDLLSDNDNIDILINNVGIGSGKSAGKGLELSKDGLELRLAVNYLSHVLLTEKIMDIINSGNGVIINVASIGQEPVDFSDLMLEKKYDGYFAYKRSKTALIMYTFDLAERLKEKGIKVNALHPASLMNTNMVLKDWGYTLSTVEEGADAVENLLFPAATGNYYDGMRKSKAISQAYDPEARYNLHEITWKLLSNHLK